MNLGLKIHHYLLHTFFFVVGRRSSCVSFFTMPITLNTKSLLRSSHLPQRIHHPNTSISSGRFLPRAVLNLTMRSSLWCLPLCWLAVRSASTTTISKPHTASTARTPSVSRTDNNSHCEDQQEQQQQEQVKVGHNAVSPNLRLILIRHGESANNVEHEISREQYLANRQPDPPLTATGQEQALETGEYLASKQNALLFPIHRLYVSPLRRTLMTAQPIAKALQLQPIVWTDIFEVGGVYENGGMGKPGMTRTEMLTAFPDYHVPQQHVTEKGWYNVAMGKETREQGRQRIVKVFETLQQQAKDATQDTTIALVVHGDFIDFVVQTAMEWPYQGRAFPCWNTCITVLDIDVTGRPMLLMHNAVSHLTTVKTQSLAKC